MFASGVRLKSDSMLSRFTIYGMSAIVCRMKGVEVGIETDITVIVPEALRRFYIGMSPYLVGGKAVSFAALTGYSVGVSSSFGGKIVPTWLSERENVNSLRPPLISRNPTISFEFSHGFV